MQNAEIPYCHLRTIPAVSTVTPKKLTHTTDRNEANIQVAVIKRWRKIASILVTK